MLDGRRRTLTRQLTLARRDGRAGVAWSLRVTFAATAAYLVGLLMFPDTQPLLASLTAMLVVQVTPVSLLASGLDRVVAVVAGVSLAVAFAAVLPLQWWSLGLLVFVALSLGQVLRLKDNRVEVAISAMLVLGVGAFSAGSAAWERIAETLVGAAVAVAANLLFPPKVGSDSVGDAIGALADRISDLLKRAADELDQVVADNLDIATVAREWLDEARNLTFDIPAIAKALEQAEEGRLFNVRAVGTADAGPGLRQGLESLEHSAMAMRGMFRAVLDATRDTRWIEAGSLTPEDIFPGTAQTFRELAAGIDAFGQLVHDEADPDVKLSAADREAISEALEGIHEARARLDDALLGGGPSELLELNAAVLATVKRMLRELDLDERVRRQLRLARRQRTPRSGPPPVLAVPEQHDPDAETMIYVPPDRKRRP